MKTITTLPMFYEHMRHTRAVKQQLLPLILNNEPVPPHLLHSLKQALNVLTGIPKKDHLYELPFMADRTISLDLSYEIEELKKDLIFLTDGEAALYSYLNTLHADFSQQLAALTDVLSPTAFHTFITDRDGTVNNYCGRYTSSIQSLYNAVFLTRFSRECVQHAILLTAAPLDNIGLVDISIMPAGAMINAGSKGREYFDLNNQRHQFPVKPDKQTRLTTLNQQLRALLNQPEYEMYGLIGSGLQFKFGQTTVARQDINGTIPSAKSTRFLTTIETLVRKLDPEDRFFRIEDTGKDIEIILTIDDESGALKDFDKGDGVRFLDRSLSLNLKQGPNLICGDTGSDVPMAATAFNECADTTTVFVTESEPLKTKVSEACPHAFFVPQPDILVCGLNNLTKRK